MVVFISTLVGVGTFFYFQWLGYSSGIELVISVIVSLVALIGLVIALTSNLATSDELKQKIHLVRSELQKKFNGKIILEYVIDSEGLFCIKAIVSVAEGELIYKKDLKKLQKHLVRSLATYRYKWQIKQIQVICIEKPKCRS